MVDQVDASKDRERLRCVCWRIVGAVLGVIGFGLVYFGLENQVSGQLVFHFGYFSTLFALFGLIASLLLVVRRSDIRPLRWQSAKWKKCLLIVAVGSWLLLVHSEWGYKIPTIEPQVVSVAENLHLDRTLFVLDDGTYLRGEFVPSSGHVVRHPWLTAFTISLMHDLTGYRIANAFVLNTLSGVLLLLLGYVQGYLFFGHRGGVMVLLLWCSLPLLTHNATGAGVDLLNVLMIQVVMLLSVLYLRKPDGMHESALCFAVVLLAHARYESVLFILPVVAVILAGWMRAGRVFLSFGAISAAPLLIPLGSLHRYMAERPDLWEIPLEYGRRFGLDFLTENLSHALYFFFNLSDHLPNSLVLPLLGLPCLLFTILIIRREGHTFWTKPECFVFTVFAIFLGVHGLLILAYYDGQLDIMRSARFALPFYLLLVLVVPFVLGQMPPKQWILRFIFGLVLVHLLSVTMPVRSKAVYRERLSEASEREWVAAYVENHLERNALIIDKYPLLWLLEGYASVSPEHAQTKSASILRSIQEGIFANAYYIERFFWNDRKSANEQMSEAVNPFRMDGLAERSFRFFEKTRISRIEGLQLEAKETLQSRSNKAD